MPREEIEPGETLESYFGQINKKKQKTLNHQPLNAFILKNNDLAKSKYSQITTYPTITSIPEKNISLPDPFQWIADQQRPITDLKNLSIHDRTLQERTHEYFGFSSKERKEEARYHCEKAHFPLQFTPNLQSKSKRQVCWHPKAALLVKYAYKTFHGSIITNKTTYNLKLWEVQQLTKRCLVCQLNEQEWVHPKGIIVAGHQGGCCSAKIADTLVPQMAPNIVNLTESFGVETDSIKVLQQSPEAKPPSKATEGSAAYNLFPLAQEIIPPHSRRLVSTGLSIEIHPSYYGQISSRSGPSSKHLLDDAARVINNNYRGVLKSILHNHSDHLFSVTPEQTVAHVLFLPLCPLPVEETRQLSTMKRGTHGFR